MRMALLVLPLALVGCDRQAELPGDPIARAATCGAVAAANARTNTPDINAPLSVTAQGDILRPALLSAAEGAEFDAARAEAVIKAMPEQAESVTDGDNWKELTPACAVAFPPAAARTVVLPDDPLVTALGCDGLGRLVRTALAQNGPDYEETLVQYRELETALDRRISPLFAQRGVTGDAAQAAEKRKAMSVFAKLGHPEPVLLACVDEFT